MYNMNKNYITPFFNQINDEQLGKYTRNSKFFTITNKHLLHITKIDGWDDGKDGMTVIKHAIDAEPLYKLEKLCNIAKKLKDDQIGVDIKCILYYADPDTSKHAYTNTKYKYLMMTPLYDGTCIDWFKKYEDKIDDESILNFINHLIRILEYLNNNKILYVDFKFENIYYKTDQHGNYSLFLGDISYISMCNTEKEDDALFLCDNSANDDIIRNTGLFLIFIYILITISILVKKPINNKKYYMWYKLNSLKAHNVIYYINIWKTFCSKSGAYRSCIIHNQYINTLSDVILTSLKYIKNMLIGIDIDSLNFTNLIKNERLDVNIKLVLKMIVFVDIKTHSVLRSNPSIIYILYLISLNKYNIMHEILHKHMNLKEKLNILDEDLYWVPENNNDSMSSCNNTIELLENALVQQPGFFSII